MIEELAWAIKSTSVTFSSTLHAHRIPRWVRWKRIYLQFRRPGFNHCCCCCCCIASIVSDSVRPHRRQPTRLPIPGILQARTLEWFAISFSNAWKWKVKGKLLSRVWLLATPWTAAYQAPLSMGFSRQEYWSGVPLPSPVQSLGQENPLEKEMATHSSILA